MASAVGMCLGVLVPILFPGVNFGVTLAIMLGFFLDLLMQGNMGYTLTALALVGALISTKYVSMLYNQFSIPHHTALHLIYDSLSYLLF